MPENVTKRLAVTFGTGLPLGAHATFKHDGQFWIAYPNKKNDQIMSNVDKLIGIYSGMVENLARWFNAHPNVPELNDLVVSLLGSIERARKVYDQLVMAKTMARTS